MRIVILADQAIADGGAPQVAIASARGLAALGHQVTYIHGVGDAGDPVLDTTPNIARIGLGGVDIWSKPALAAARDGIWNGEYAERLSAILRQFSSEDTVVHVHQWTKYFSASLFSMLRKSGLPLAISFHDYFLTCPTGLKYRFDKAEPCTLAPLSGACLVAPCDPRSMAHKLIRIARTVAAGRALKSLPFSVVHVSEQGRRTIGSYLAPDIAQHVIENPIEVPRPVAARDGIGSKVVYCGRLTAEKGAMLVAEAALAAGMPSLFIGEGPLRGPIKALDPTAEITGWLDKAAVRARIAAEARVVVAPSLWPETGPMVTSEAMAAGVPVIISERAGASARVQHGVTGFVVPPEVEPLKAAMLALKDEALARAMGLAAKAAYWADPPSIESHARKLVSVYEGLVRVKR